MIRVDAFYRLQRLRQVKLRRKVIHHLQLSVLLYQPVCDARRVDVRNTYLCAYAFHSRNALGLLKRMNLHGSGERNGFELFMDVIQDLVVDLERLEDLPIRILKRKAGKVGSDLTPVCVRAAPMRRPQEDDELCPTADHLRSTDGL